MSSQNFIINKYNEPFIFDSSKDLNLIKNVILIDNTVKENKIFYNSSSHETFPIIYSRYSDRVELLNLLETRFNYIERIGFVMHNSCMPYKKFINNEEFFIESDLVTKDDTNNTNNINNNNSENFKFLIDIIKKFSVKHVDFLACKLLLENKWVKYFNLLTEQTGIIIGASDDNTGNIKYGGDWILETTGEDIQYTYWMQSIENYTSHLAITLLEQNGGQINLRQNNATSNVEYNTTYNSTWISLGTNWPIEIKNSQPSSSNILTVNLTTDITISDSTVGSLDNFYIEIGSEYITVTGENLTTKKIIINQAGELNIYSILFTDYHGFIRTTLYGNCTVQYIGLELDQTIGSTPITLNGGGICKPGFAVNNEVELENCYVNNCYSTISIQGGTIAPGVRIGSGGIIGEQSSGTAYNCYSTGQIIEDAGGIFGRKSYKSARAINCNSSGIMGGTNGGSGGIFGGSCRGVAEYCHSTGEIGRACGGIFGGECDMAVAICCYSSGSISHMGGGIFGDRCTILAINCYSTGLIGLASGPYGGGGIAGGGSTNGCSGTVIGCYSLGNINSQCGGIFAANPGYIKIINCYVAGKLLYSVSDDNTFKGSFVGIAGPTWDNFYTDRYVSGVTFENSYAENLQNTDNNGWNDTRAKTYLTGSADSLNKQTGGLWVSAGNNVPFTIITPANSRTLNGFAVTSPITYSPTPFATTAPTSSTGTGTITYFSNLPMYAEINNQTGIITMIGAQYPISICACLQEGDGYRSYTVILPLSIVRATRTINYSIPNQLFVANSSFSTSGTLSEGTGTILYTSLNTQIATVNETTGVVTMLSQGNVTIRAISNETRQYNGVIKNVTFNIGNGKLYFGQSLASPGIYYISNSDSSLNGKTIQVASDGSITVLTNSNVYTTNTKKALVNDSELTEGNLILTKSGLKYTLDGNTWN